MLSLKNNRKIFMVTDVESEQGEGYHEVMYVIATTEQAAKQRFIKEMNSTYITYLYNWIGEIKPDNPDYNYLMNRFSNAHAGCYMD